MNVINIIIYNYLKKSCLCRIISNQNFKSLFAWAKCSYLGWLQL